MIYTGTGDITLKVLTHRNLSEAENLGLKYKKPDGTDGSVDLTDGVELHSDSKTIIWSVQDDEFFDQPGRWRFQAFAIFDGVTAHGDDFSFKVHENLSS